MKRPRPAPGTNGVTLASVPRGITWTQGAASPNLVFPHLITFFFAQLFDLIG